MWLILPLVAIALHLLAWVTALFACGGLAVVVAGVLAVRRFARTSMASPHARPPVSVLIPLCGPEPMLDRALDSFCRQAYPDVQLILGVQDPADPAMATARALAARYPALEIVLVADPRLHGCNRKVSNLINMLPRARHDLLVIADSDLHVAPVYLDHIVAALERPGVGLVTTVCAGLPTTRGLAARLGATAISHTFLSGALLSRQLGREDCLGTTMALHRSTLAAIGGLQTLVHHLADDNVMGQRVQALGLSTALATTVPSTAVPEASMAALWRHEMRWARTIRKLEPSLYIASSLQFPLFWAAASIAFSGGTAWSAGLFATAWIMRAWASRAVDTALHRASPPSPAGTVIQALLPPLRDGMSVAQIALSFLGDRVIWRGHGLRADRGAAEGARMPTGLAYPSHGALPPLVAPTRPV